MFSATASPSDASWLYSAAAQSTAAIVAIVGGFLVGRIIARSTDRQGTVHRVADLDQRAAGLEARLQTAVQIGTIHDRMPLEAEIAMIDTERQRLTQYMTTFARFPRINLTLRTLGTISALGILYPLFLLVLPTTPQSWMMRLSVVASVAASVGLLLWLLRHLAISDQT